MFRRALILSLGLFMAASAALADAPARYFAALPDVPVMPGMTERGDSALVFDKAEGRVIETAAEGHELQAETVIRFYQQTLESLGWRQAAPLRFVREGEQLVVKIEQAPGAVRARFFLSPDASK